MNQITNLFFRLAEALLVLLLTLMVVMVFGNVVLRYGFNTGLDFSEELSRFFFIWITFLGAIIAMRENAHLGLDTLVRLLPQYSLPRSPSCDESVKITTLPIKTTQPARHVTKY